MRLEMTKKSDLALKAMRCIGDAEGERIAGRALAEKLGITTHYLPQVISPLVKAGWIASTPGPRGGYRLLSSLKAVSVLEVIEVIEGRIEDQGCVQRGIPCPETDLCALHVPWQKARDAMLIELGAATIEDCVRPCIELEHR
ncbi:MAG: Rrf2 family transcriptional regulator [Actinomycetota bacterium]|nr:Rrf2 family transcriptional regulator [Actinomycetota bacterium]MDK1016673.1 Rrf2 family transcriptional regulator [Actinomycetota bacterium]MDK1027049.1 Rrf2 family transcriptional regulator [Actinomycetota bacterium]MDK1038619.1 Rrf2 family transcriptional regulator [Actinomycetota bacterium]MDK1096526.1 Rrf2 family transcriptional regulator [Actinomycetota bacterium]